MSQCQPSQGNLPTKPISLDATGNIEIVPPAGQQTADPSGKFLTFVENKADARLLPLNMSGFGPLESGVFRPENYDQSQFARAIYMKTLERSKPRYLAPNQARQLY